MGEKDIDELVNKLREEIASLDSNSEIYKDITTLIARIDEQSSVDNTSMAANIRGYIEKFEVEHPVITNVLSELSIKLMNIGV